MIANKAKEKIIKGVPVTVAFLAINDVVAAETVARCGIDILVLDNEHMALNDRDILNLTAAVKAAGVCCLLRTAVKEINLLTRYMEFGIDGICATRVSSLSEARTIVRAVKYPPLGERGICQYSKGFNCGFIGDMSVSDYMEHANRNTIIFVTLESRSGTDDAGKIAKLEGVDSVHIGANDLSASMGFMGSPKAPEVVEVVKKAQKEILDAGNTTNAYAESREALAEAIKKGEKVIFVGSDLKVLRTGFSSLAL